MSANPASTATVVPEGDVDPAYRHTAKLIQPGPELAAGDSLLKWYDIAPADAAISDEIRELARAGLRQRAGEIPLGRDLGFAILHRCGESFYFLLVSTWRNENELWETVWAKNGEDEPSFRPWPFPGTHRGTFCVWELGAVWHEQQAWSQYLRSERDEAARLTYAQDSFTGEV